MTSPTPTPPGHRPGQPVPAPRSAPGEAAAAPAPQPGPSRVVVVDDHAMFRTGVKAEIGQAVSLALQGAKTGSITVDSDLTDVYLRTHAPNATPEQIANFKLPVSQLQQQKAVEKATDKLEDRSDALKEKSEDLKDRSEALTGGDGLLHPRQHRLLHLLLRQLQRRVP